MADSSQQDAVLVDTDVFSYLMRAQTPQAAIYRPHVERKIVCISFVTVGELLFGAYRRNWGEAKMTDLLERFRSVVIVPFDFEVCKVYADLRIVEPGTRVERASQSLQAKAPYLLATRLLMWDRPAKDPLEDLREHLASKQGKGFAKSLPVSNR